MPRENPNIPEYCSLDKEFGLLSGMGHEKRGISVAIRRNSSSARSARARGDAEGVAITEASVEAPYRDLSLWWAQLPGPVNARPALQGDGDFDVVVVGGGFSGLWTAHALVAADPSVRVAIVEAEVAGFGASGRNGGWCSALFPVSSSRIAAEHGVEAARSMSRALQATVDEVGRSAAVEGIECGFHKGGTVVAARNAAQVARAQADLEAGAALGFGAADLRWMEADEARRVVDIDGMLGATFTPHCASLDPARLARGLAEAVERRDVALFEHTTALELRPGSPGRRPEVVTTTGTLRAEVVVIALEAWSSGVAPQRRTIVPVYSLMVATEPLDDAMWHRIGLTQRETFSDHRHLVIYGQRTADGRIAFGGRGAPYHFGSAVRERFDHDIRIHEGLHRTLVELFPCLVDVPISHRWGGPLGVPRDWHPSVGLDRSSGLAWAGGYVGDGVAASNLAGRTIADLVLRRHSDLVRLPWVGHRSRTWEPEPLRWLGINAALWATNASDRMELRSRRPSQLATRLRHLLGA